MNSISAVIIAYNEEQRIEDCLKSLIPFCEEIILVDSFSTDKTVEIARKFTSKIYTHKFESAINQINYATSLATNDWVFCLDADERVSSELLKKINRLKEAGFTADAYTVNRLNYYMYSFFKYCGWYPDSKIRLFNRTKGSWGGSDPHYKVIMNSGSKIDDLKSDIIHFTYRDLHHQIEKVNNFSSMGARHKLKGRVSFVRLRIIINPMVRFFKSYVIQRGFLGGTRGFVNSIIAAFDVFSKYAKIWEGQHRKDPPSTNF